MASRAPLLLLLLQTLLIFSALASSIESVRGEEMEGELPSSLHQSAFVRRRLAETKPAWTWGPWGQGEPWGKRPWAKGGRGVSCKSNPSVCYASKQVCCKSVCVDTHSDSSNCGWCGKACKFTQKCCWGKCVSVLTDKYNCGQCGKKCPKKDTCTGGMCGYNGGH